MWGSKGYRTQVKKNVLRHGLSVGGLRRLGRPQEAAVRVKEKVKRE